MEIFNFSAFLQDYFKTSYHVLDSSIQKKDYVSLDLSVKNQALECFDFSVSNNLNTYINTFLFERNAKVAFGGYLEKRNLYKRSNYFNDNTLENERNIHLGIDLWCPAQTPIFSLFNATVHSFKNNTQFGDYGPTIILCHHINEVVFYTLYGHLSLESIANLEIGQVFKQNQQIGALGESQVNGDYPPHLHFQIIKDLQGNFGDYPGVCNESQVDFYKINCPDPNLILKL
ncbi:peptidoglycan DD-metalloendopeptidase family protein [Siansivirga zeaxanthinifaciens]|uniref:Peptidase M23 n=1 Tax=Siansivirga zeaxanthinifaciens CC-SAMT-1 TaxID=1454006 RepID=A0A0C5VWE8_9FLAO|nr:peptidoglycan DD-metalloendopeptidase family protein [Siansivirga zeaxanthinifaciens]AJR03436.1 peptidase M23 [Siansivirga zeaxanthinifaciens CC-SAMT-1]